MFLPLFLLLKTKKPKAIFIEPIVGALRLGILPLVFGDVIIDEVRGCCIFSGETTLDNLSFSLYERGFKIEKVIQAGITDGVYDLKGKIISKITPKNFGEIKKALRGAEGIDVTGGMIHKVEESLKMARRGIKTWIINGLKRDNLYKAIVAKPTWGTLIAGTC